ncbi:MAG: PKD domain-containing protein [Gaiellaceae bacterium]
MRIPRLGIGVLATYVVAGIMAGAALAGIVDVNPDVSDNGNANASTGGRINAGLGADPGNPGTFYAASEYGGLFKTTDFGATWTHLDDHVPSFTWDVEVDPSNSNRVYATSWYDGRVSSLAGIARSTNGGTTWSKPATSTPPAAYNCAQARKDEPSAFGIGIRPDAPQNVFVGTNCGVAISTNSGVTWTFADPTPATAATDVWDVVVQGGGPSGQGIVDVCGADGHYRSTDGGGTWTGGSPTIPGGRCSITVSPDESYVLFIVASDNLVYESDDAGATWTSLGNQGAQGRIPFVVTNQRADDGDDDVFDLWYSDTQLFRGDCTTPDPPAQGGANRCPAVASFTNFQTGAHWDAGDLAFDPTVAVDACPLIYTTDGGAHTNTVGGSPGCHSPTWTRSNSGLHALWLWSMDGADRAGAGEDLYFGTQDNGTFATLTADSNPPTWTNPRCCDTFDIVADPAWVVATTCCFSSGRFNRVELGGANYAGAAQINTYPAGNVPGFTFGKRINQFGPTHVVMITTAGVFVTNDITASPIVWSGLAAMPAGANPCHVDVALSGGTPTFVVQSGQCTGRGNDQVFTYVGTGGAGTWTRIDNNDGLTGGFGIVAVDPNDPNNLYASNLPAAGPQMVFSTDGGATWDNDAELDGLMTGGGVFQYQNQRGPSTNRGGAGAIFQGYPQPSLIAFSAEDGDVLVAGGQDSGVFLSLDGGDNWSLVTDPIDPGASGVPHLSRPRYAYFDHEPADGLDVYVGTQGRGVWRLSFAVPTADANGPYTTDEGVDVVLDGSGSSHPNGDPLTYEWDFDGDGDFDDATGVSPTFDLVGQDGVFPVALKVTDPNGAYDVDETTVTVDNVAPTVSLGSNAPQPENTAVTVTGTISDPGWLDPLTATIDWGDGTPVENVAGVLENVRPDATLVFAVVHIYGDNGTFTAEVCGSDDDTTTCEEIDLAITNVDPTAEIDLSGATLVNGIPTIFGEAGEPVDFSGRSQDPGSDDLTLRWAWDDGTPDTVTTYLVNPPLADPFPSPSIQPRDVTDDVSHTFGDACMYEIGFSAVDDDLGASPVANANVLIVGNADERRSAGYWHHQYKGNGKTDFDAAELECYLEIAAWVSTVFNEVVDASTIANALAILDPSQSGGDIVVQFDRQLLAALLNFANGSIGWDEAVDTNGDGVADTPFHAAVAAAEAVRLNPASTKQEIKAHKNVLERINLGLA